ncbi:MAG: NAD(P)H-hydrate dehydratase [Lachnospiraceae bacterium]|nr:NAD(P)H-hydrate dehydratase [Lachnospiraceae bacterium]
MPVREADGNKGDFGKVLVIAGSRNMAGAAYFCAKAAYLSGAGLVRIFSPESNRVILQTLIPEAMLTTFLDDKEPDISVLEDAIKKADVIAAGPGLGKSGCARTIVHTVLEKAGCPCVLDADFLNILSEDPGLFSLIRDKKMILTPHIGEMSRISGIPVRELKEERTKQASRFAYEHGITLVMKDSQTVIAGPDGSVSVNRLYGNNGMATGGSGDVLCGLIAGFIGQGASLEDGAKAGVLAHALAGDLAAEKKGVRSMTASDILDHIPEILKD